jgi:hypothetical protein
MLTLCTVYGLTTMNLHKHSSSPTFAARFSQRVK